jgi:hypothetical protein
MIARVALFLSLLLNLLLIATAIRMATVIARHDSEKRMVPIARAAQGTIAPEPVSAFRWSQIESTNYLTYVSNLRSIGCPEQTIRDLIVADVESFYAPRRDQLRRQTVWSASELQRQLNAVGREETNLIAYILDWPSKVRQADAEPVLIANSPGVETQTNLQRAQGTISLPLAFLSIDTNFVQLDDRQWGLIQNLQRGFVDELGGGNADPASADYAERWSKAQPEYDEMLEVVLGREAYIEFQKQAAGRRAKAIN